VKTLFAPEFITFDCYGTLTDFQMSNVTKQVLGDRLRPESASQFLDIFEAYRMDEVLGGWKPYEAVITCALQRAMLHCEIDGHEDDASRIYSEIPNWGPHADVPSGLARLSERYSLVILSNAANDQIRQNVEKLGTQFHAIYTAEDAGAYKPRLAAFEFMLDQLGCRPDDIVHVSSSLRYDLIPCHDLGIRNKVYVNRQYEPSTPYYGYEEVAQVSELPALFR
jgi:2-haloacid dehalogenase